MRLFAAIDIPESIREALIQTVQKLKPTARARWSKPENLHITTKFLGEVPIAKLDAVIAALRAMPARSPFRSKCGFGWLQIEIAPPPVCRHPGTGWLGQLHLRTDQALTPLGVPETKPYRPHLTIARLTPGWIFHCAKRFCTCRLSCSAAADRFHLYESLTGGAGSVYRKLAEFPI